MVEGCALLVNVSVAPAEPATVGLNVIVNEALWPAGIVCGRENPPIVKTELFVLAPVTVTLAPLAVTVPLAVPLDPTVTLPRASDPGDTLNRPAAVVTPVPETGTVNVGLLAVDVTVRFPLAEPPALGANDTVKVALCPPLSVNGVVIPLTLNPAPVTPTWVTDTLEPPVFVMVSESVPVLPTFTLPKGRLVGFALIAPAATPVPFNGIVIGEFTASEVTTADPVR